MRIEQEVELWDYLESAKGIAWDTCHKIYILMDDKQMEQMRTYEYDPLISADSMSVADMFKTVVQWYQESCGLKFIQAVTSFPDGEEDYHEIIGQFNDIEEKEEDE